MDTKLMTDANDECEQTELKERAAQAEADNAALRGLALDARHYLVYGSRNFDAIQAVIDRISAALSADHPGAALLADVRKVARAMRYVCRSCLGCGKDGSCGTDECPVSEALRIIEARGLDKEEG